MIHYFMGQHDAALADARRAIELNPSFAYGLFLLARMASLYGFADEALEHVSVGIRLSPRESE